MKIAALLSMTIAAFLFLTLSIHSESSNKESGFVTASTLYCRSGPGLKNKIIDKLKFGTPVILSKPNNSRPVTIAGKTDYWYKVDTSGCWIFGGFVLYSPHKYSAHLEREVISYNMVCGGNSCGSSFEAALINDFYAAPVYFEDYCIDEGDTPPLCKGLIIGRYRKDSSGIYFENPAFVIAYDASGKPHLGSHETFNNRPFYRNWNSNQKLYAHKDSSGKYYANKNYSKTKRETAKIKPSNPEPRDSPVGVYYTEVIMDIFQLKYLHFLNQ
ncbi:MAG: SH3 domain-containing protein [Spirochaetia bacterium]|nr:SH3 domain-containing protein [Spirochaetia bacterium]